VSPSLKSGACLVGFGVVLSQLGHLLVYQLQFGASAYAVQSTGVHAYFPVFAKTGLGLGAGALLASLLVIGAARIAAAGRGRNSIAGGPSYLSLLGALFTVQLVFFAVQETAEATAAGTAVATAPHLLLLGSVGQLPVALLAALALKWLLVQFDSAVTELRVAVTSMPLPVAPAATAIFIWSHVDLVPRAVTGASLAKRGPPSALRFSSN
jgi:hypothetical protein